jgi:hypothetical protein
MQVFMILLNIACNMQNMQNNMHDMQNMQTSFPICRICTAHFADDTRPLKSAILMFRVSRSEFRSQLAASEGLEDGLKTGRLEDGLEDGLKTDRDRRRDLHCGRETGIGVQKFNMEAPFITPLKHGLIYKRGNNGQILANNEYSSEFRAKYCPKLYSFILVWSSQ